LLSLFSPYTVHRTPYAASPCILFRKESEELEETLVSLQESLAARDTLLRDSERACQQRERDRHIALAQLEEARADLRQAREERERLRGVEEVVKVERERREAEMAAKKKEVSSRQHAGMEELSGAGGGSCLLRFRASLRAS
jgi:hypothetical protein